MPKEGLRTRGGQRWPSPSCESKILLPQLQRRADQFTVVYRYIRQILVALSSIAISAITRPVVFTLSLNFVFIFLIPPSISQLLFHGLCWVHIILVSHLMSLLTLGGQKWDPPFPPKYIESVRKRETIGGNGGICLI